MRSDSPRKVDFTVTITPNQEPQVLLPGNHQLETWEKWLEVSRAVAYFFGSLLFLFGSIFFYPEYSAKWNGNAVVFASWGFVIGCIYFFAGANLDFIQSIRYNHGTQLRQVLRAFTALCNYMAASTFVLGALYFLPSWYPKSPELGCWAFINGCILFCIGAIVEILFICTTHGDPRVSGFRITNMFCWGAAATLSTLVSSVFFIIGSWFYLPEYINRADDGTHYMNTAITFYVLGSVCFVVNSCVLALGVYRTVTATKSPQDDKCGHATGEYLDSDKGTSASTSIVSGRRSLYQFDATSATPARSRSCLRFEVLY